MLALERASVGNDIAPFAAFLGSLVRVNPQLAKDISAKFLEVDRD